MAIPAAPSVGSRALYYSYATPTTPPVSAGQPAVGPVAGYTSYIPAVPTTPLPDIGNPGVPLPAIVASVSGTAPDYQGMVLLVHLPNGTVVPRSAGFTSGQPLLSQATWTTQGSNALQSRWALVDALS